MISATVRPLSDDLKKVAYIELNEVENRITEDLVALRNWIKMQPHLKARTDDQFLLAFLRGSKHSLEKAKAKIDYFYTIKTMMPEVFKNIRVDQKYKDLVLSGSILWPQKPSYISGPEVGITRFYDGFDYKRFKLIDLIRFRALCLEYMLNKVDNCTISGYIEIYDLKKISLGLYAQADFVMIKKLTVFFEKAVPLRLKGIHIINVPKEGYDILQIVKSLVPREYKNLFYVHKNVEDLYEHVSRECLPVEYGGTNGTVAEIAAENERLLSDFNHYCEENDQYKVEEHLRPNKKIDAQSLFGLEGSFRKLNID